jgi:hypothetical protein
MSFQGMGQSISRCAQEQKQKTMRDKPDLNRRELTATAQSDFVQVDLWDG